MTIIIQAILYTAIITIRLKYLILNSIPPIEYQKIFKMKKSMFVQNKLS